MNKYYVDYIAHGVEQSGTTVKADNIALALVNAELWLRHQYKGIPHIEIIRIALMYDEEE